MRDKAAVVKSTQQVSTEIKVLEKKMESTEARLDDTQKKITAIETKYMKPFNDFKKKGDAMKAQYTKTMTDLTGQVQQLQQAYMREQSANPGNKTPNMTQMEANMGQLKQKY